MRKKLTDYQNRKLTDYALENYLTYLNPSEMKKDLRELVDMCTVLNEEKPAVLSFKGQDGHKEEIAVEPMQASEAEFETPGEKNRRGFFFSLLEFIGRCFLYFAILGCVPSLRKTVRFGEPILLAGCLLMGKPDTHKRVSQLVLLYPSRDLREFLASLKAVFARQAR